MDHVDAVVVGAGIVGLACAQALAQAGHEVLVIEASEGIGTGVSSRNSEVIHAGLYYPRDSLKARLCVRGRDLLYAYAASRGVAVNRCGKLVVATDASQEAPLDALLAQAHRNGVSDVVRIDAAQARALEPQVHCVAALLSPSSGIADSHGVMLALQGDIENAGGMVVFHTRFLGAAPVSDGFELRIEGAEPLRTRWLVNSAGLGAQAVAQGIESLAPRHIPTLYHARGQYASLSGRAPFQRLVYPLPEPGGLGVHFTLDMGAQGKFGPDVQWAEAPDYRLDATRSDAFYAEVRKYWPALPDGALQPSYVGVRPKISGPGEPAADFRIDGAELHGLPGLVNLFGIESPGLTASLAIAEVVAARLAEPSR